MREQQCWDAQSAAATKIWGGGLLLFMWLSSVRLFATPWTEAHPAPLVLEFSRIEYWSG